MTANNTKGLEMTGIVITDDDIGKKISQPLALSAMREAFKALYEGRLTAPPRVKSKLGDIELDFTTGELKGKWFGYRSNGVLLPNGSSEQVVALNEIPSGDVIAISTGHLLGPYRTGAIGGVAVDLLANIHADTLTLIGTGPQAWTQIWAISAVRNLKKVTIYSRDSEKRTIFAKKVRDELNLHAVAVDNPEKAVRESEIVVLATNSFEPVISAEWINPGTHINTLGPKFENGSEMGEETIAKCTHLFTDAPLQLKALHSLLMSGIKDRSSQIISLSDVNAKPNHQARSTKDISLFFSTGLAGTELFLLEALAQLIQSSAR